MARPIKDTPTIYGKDAETFFRHMEETERKAPDLERIRRIKASISSVRFIDEPAQSPRKQTTTQNPS